MGTGELLCIAHTTLEKFENATTTGHFAPVFEETQAMKSHDYCDVTAFGKARFKNIHHPH